MIKTTESTVRKPLAEAMAAYCQRQTLRLHMPGHKGKPPQAGLGSTWGQAWQQDLTEVPGLDQLSAPHGVIRESELLLAKLYRSKDAHFLVNGATVGLQAAIMASCHQGDKILLPRNAHRSIWSGVALSGATPVWLPVFQDADHGVPLGVATETVVQAVAENPDAKAIVYTYPSYHGFCGDLKKMTRPAGEKGMFTIVDEAHGAHFAFTGWPDAAVDSGAAVVVQGWHKTMGSLTQTGVLLQNDHTYPVEQYLAMLQSSSPSYLLMASLDEARANWEAHRDELAAVMLRRAGALRDGIAALPNLGCYHASNIPWPVKDYDQTRITLYSELGHSGWQLQELLEKAGLVVEMADSGTVVLILTYADTEEEVEAMLAALGQVAAALETVPPRPAPFINFGNLPEVAMTPAEALQKDMAWVSFDDAIGRVAAGLVVPYPPGIPVVGPGEVITESCIAGLEYLLEEGGMVQGVEAGKVPVII